jgi:hypothetical protein
MLIEQDDTERIARTETPEVGRFEGGRSGDRRPWKLTWLGVALDQW